MPRLLSVGVLIAVALGCASGTKQSAMRSPTYDYPADGPWGPTTASGESIGADRQSASDKLRTGPTIGNQGIKPPAYPATEAREQEEVQGPEQPLPEPQREPTQEEAQ
ncbi:MAG TPA: hypothetical protein VM686_19735 [Polyangiaceae bacterium]|jgi:hypothetical protein|nr:hypothetical protein [Polyangiaceae bacterium]